MNYSAIKVFNDQSPFTEPPFSWKSRFKSFSYAANGISLFFRTGHNAWIQLAAALLLVPVSVWLEPSLTEIVLLLIFVVLVFALEMINTAIEKTIGLLHPTYHSKAGAIKDIAAGAVLMASFGASITAALIFIPKIISLWHGSN